MNKVILIGYVGGDVEVKEFEGGDKQAQFSLATTKMWKDKETNEKKQKTQWHNIIVNGNKRVDVIKEYVSKGDRLMVEGSLAYRTYEPKEQPNPDKPTKVYITEIKLQQFEFLTPKTQTDKPHPNEQPSEDGDMPF